VAVIFPLQLSVAVGIVETVAGVERFNVGNEATFGTGAKLSTTVTVIGAVINTSVPVVVLTE